MPKYTVYGRPNCPWCEKATALLATTNHRWSYFDLSKDAELRQTLIDKGYKTVPVIYYGYKPVGGYEDLVKHLGADD